MRTASSKLRRLRWTCALALLGAWAAAALLGCGSPKQRYEMLSFFFDGVPNPDQAAAEAQAKAERARRAGGSIVLVRHKPFEEENCTACHKNQTDGGQRAAFFTAVAAKAPKADVCMDCHADVPGKYEVMHGPVAVNACTFCHSAHSSKHASLLKAPAHKLCMQCHGPTGLSQGTEGHALAESNCLECHSGHGGGRNLLKNRAVLTGGMPTDFGEMPDRSPSPEARVIGTVDANPVNAAVNPGGTP